MVTRFGETPRKLKNSDSGKSLKELKKVRVMLAQNTTEFCKNTTIHGLKYVTNNELHPCERGFFAVSIIAVLLISGYLMFNVYTRWRTSPVIISIKPEPTFIDNEPFPAVTICNLNQALNSTAQSFSKTSTEYAMLQLLCKQEANNTIASTITNWSGLDDFIVNISQPCSKMVIGCRYGGREFDCEEFFYPLLTDEGLCCVFNMVHPDFMYLQHIPKTLRNRTHKVHQAINWYAEKGYPKKLPRYYYPRATTGTGESLGLTVVLDVQHNEYYCSSGNGIGFKISLHSPNESPNVRETGVVISPGHEIKLRIQPQKTEAEEHLRSLHKNYRRCLFHNEGRLRYFAHYTQRNCEMECIAQMLLNYCGCVSFYMPRMYDNVSICSIHRVKCVETVRLRTDPTIISCLDNCLPSCFELSFIGDAFNTRISHDGFTIADHRVENFSHRYVEQSIAVVNMYFKDNSFHSHIQTEFIGITDFLSSVGGLMGLFLGFSFFSIAEFIYFAIIRPCRTVRQSKHAVHQKPGGIGNAQARASAKAIRYLTKQRRAYNNQYRSNSPNAINRSVTLSKHKAQLAPGKDSSMNSPQMEPFKVEEYSTELHSDRVGY